MIGSGCHSSNQCYYGWCDSENIGTSQPIAATTGLVYDVSFWYYHLNDGSDGGSSTVETDVTI
jgi:hypothetical protein